MFLKVQILERLVSGFNRYFKVNLFSRQTQNLVQFHSGGDDYNPPANVEGLGGSIGDSPSNGFIFGWRDSTERKCQPGEKRLYAVDTNGNIVGELFLKNTGIVDFTAVQTNLGQGGQRIARLGDEVTVTVPTHGECKGTITTAGVNTSI